MKKLCSIWTFLLFSLSLFSQHYLKGEIKDESGKLLSNVKIILQSTGYVYYSGSSGSFGITSPRAVDSAIVLMDGYQTIVAALAENKQTTVTLKLLQTAGNTQKKRLVSFTKDLEPKDLHRWSFAGETYSTLVENDFITAEKFPETGFAVNTDKASYSNIRRFITMGSIVPPDAVRIEEMMNYFTFGYIEPLDKKVFAFDSQLTGCPWKNSNQLLLLKVCAKKLDPEKMPASNLVFLIDISGSMDMPNRLPLLKAAFKLMINNLREKDTVSIVVYGSTAGVWMQPTSGKEKKKIRQSIEDLSPGGATSGSAGIQTAYRLAKSQFITGGNNRVILATDGDFNVGQISDEELEKMIAKNRQSGIYLTCLGVGMGNYKDSKLEVLAKKGNGNFAYLDEEKEAEKVLVKELTQTLYTVADETYLNIRFNPAYVKEYRLIGFDNRLNAVADSLSELEGGEVGSGHSLLALFELVPAKIAGDHQASLAQVTMNYKCPSDSTQKTSVYSCPVNYTAFNQIDSAYQFAASVAMFGSLLKHSDFIAKNSWNELLQLANQSYSREDALQKEFVVIIEKAKKIYAKKKRK